MNSVDVPSTTYLPPTKGEACAIARDVCLSVGLSVSKITEKHVHGFGWNFACRQMSGHGWTDQLLSPIRIIVRMPEPENLKVEDLSKSVKQVPHSEQATGYEMHCREILFTPRCSPRAREFPGSVDLSVWRTVAELRGVKLAQFLDFVGGTCAPLSAFLVEKIGFVGSSRQKFQWLKWFNGKFAESNVDVYWLYYIYLYYYCVYLVMLLC